MLSRHRPDRQHSSFGLSFSFFLFSAGVVLNPLAQAKHSTSTHPAGLVLAIQYFAAVLKTFVAAIDFQTFYFLHPCAVLLAPYWFHYVGSE
mmetsp:Transcript_126218/g.288923  ORF Transcript_126218/g.288923 Transcript_126218/m.288923 type:complete len:91 (-) Transcript_126218:141-413(-)